MKSGKFLLTGFGWKLTALVMAAVLLVSCAAPAAPTAAPAAPAKPAATTAPAAAVSSGVLRVAINIDIQPKNPHRMLEGMYPWLRTVYDVLTTYDDKLVPQPVLAESWSWSADNLTLTMKIRKGVKFHSGRDLTAEDVEWNFKRLQDAKTNSQMRPAASKIETFTRPDSHTLVMKFKATAPEFFDVTEQMVVMDPTTVAEVENGGKHSGTGPFIWKEWIPDSKWVGEKNPNYWQTGQPKVDRIEFQVIKDRDAMALNLEAGSVDLVVSPNTKDTARFQADSKYKVILSANEAPRLYAGVNILAKPFDNPKVRQALNYAMPRERFTKTTLLNLGKFTAIPWPMTSPAYDKAQSESYGYSIDKAKALLAEAGVAAGTPLILEYSTGVAELKEFAVFYEQELAALGFKVSIEPLEPANYTTKNLNKEFKNVWLGPYSGHSMYPSSLLTNNNPFRAGDNTSNYKNQQYEDLVKVASTEMDPAKQKDAFLKINKILLDESFNMAIANQAYAWVSTAKVSGLVYNKTNMLAFGTIAVTK